MAKSYVNRNKKSPRYGKRYTKGKGGVHIYKIGGNRIVIGGKKPPPDPFAAEVDAATTMRYGEKERQIGSERRISQQAALNSNSWWGDYQRELAAAEQRANQGYQQATNQIQGQANLSYQQDSAADAARLAEANRQAALRGTVASEGDAGQAASARRSLSNAMAGKVAFEGANQAAYGARATAAGAGIKALKGGEEAARRRQIEKTYRDLLEDKGAFRVDHLQKLKDAYHKKRLEILTFEGKAAAQAFDQQYRREAQRLTQRGQDLSAETQRRGQDLTRRGQDISAETQRRGQDLTDARGREKGGSKGKSSFTPTQIRGSRDKYLHIADVARSNKTDSKGRKHTWGWHYKNARAANKGVPPDLVKAALQRGLRGGVDPALARKIFKQYGLRVKAYRGRPIPREKGSGQPGTGRPS